MKRAHRLVILPDYQGIGLGVRFLEAVADHYVGRGFRFSIVTSARNLVCALARSPRWKFAYYNRKKAGNRAAISHTTATIIRRERAGCKSGSFYYRPGERNQ